MRLIHARTYALEEYFNARVPPYAILSHTWEMEEVIFTDMADIESAKQKRGFRKIQYTCEQARRDGLQYVWVDTCCIDKRSSAELQEAINSMYRWYHGATICYTYLSDIMSSCPPLSDYRILSKKSEPGPTEADFWIAAPKFGDKSLDDEELDFWTQAFGNSKWFGRGWTLQELIAPRQIKFYGVSWNWIGTKSTLLLTLSTITHIDIGVLNHDVSTSDICFARRMSWAASRITTRVEDEAYSLLGIMGVNIPLLYGEGRRAFQRLQDEMVRSSKDLSIFAWDTKGSTDLFATSPSAFLGSHDIEPFGQPDDFELTAYGVKMSCPVIATPSFLDDNPTKWLAVLNCRRTNASNNVLGLNLRQNVRTQRFYVVTSADSDEAGEDIPDTRLAIIEFQAVSRASTQLLEIVKSNESPNQQITVMFRLAMDNDDPDTMARIADCLGFSSVDVDTPCERSLRTQRHRFQSVSILLSHALADFCINFGGHLERGERLSDISRLVGLEVTSARPSYGPTMHNSFWQRARIWEPCRHGIDCNDGTGYECVNMFQTRRAWDPTRSIALSASINLSEVYGELLCDVRASFGRLSDMPMAITEQPQELSGDQPSLLTDTATPDPDHLSSLMRERNRLRKLAAILR